MSMEKLVNGGERRSRRGKGRGGLKGNERERWQPFMMGLQVPHAVVWVERYLGSYLAEAEMKGT